MNDATYWIPYANLGFLVTIVLQLLRLSSRLTRLEEWRANHEKHCNERHDNASDERLRMDGELKDIRRGRR